MASNFKTPRLKDKAYRDSAPDHDCLACGHPGADGSVVLAHIATVNNSGMGLKPGDDESLFLCSRCHSALDTSPDRAGWLVAHVLIPMRREAYRGWQSQNSRYRQSRGFEQW
jgi:hypothetical protein